MKLAAEQIKAVARSRWALPLLLVVVALVLAWRLDAGRRAEGEAARLAEAEVLRQRGVVVAATARARELDAALRAAVARSEDLGAELERVRAAAPGARPVLVATGATGRIIAGGSPRAPEERGPAAASSEGQAGASGPQSHDPPAAECPGAPACLLAVGDEGEIRTSIAGVETRAGNLVVIGAAEAWRLSPGPASRILSGPLRLETTVVERGAGPGWGGGVWGAAGRRGWLAGPALSPPPIPWWLVQLEATIGGGAGPGGEWGAGGTVILRRR